jgi:hypothetical protein
VPESKTSPSDVYNNSFKLPPNAAKVRLRILNYANAGVSTTSYWHSPSVQVASGGKVTANQIVAGTITAASGIIANLAVESAKIANLAVGNAALGNLAVTNAKIGTLAVSTGQIQDLAVTNGKIANLAIDNAKIANATITSAKISSIDAAKITTGILKAVSIDGTTVAIKDTLTLDQVASTAGFYLNPVWSGSAKETVIRVSGVTNPGLADERHTLQIDPNVDNPNYNGRTDIYGDFIVWDKTGSAPSDLLNASSTALRRRGKFIPFGHAGSAKAVYSSTSLLAVRVALDMPSIPYVVASITWVSGSVSTNYTEIVYTENISTTGFDIKVKDTAARFSSASYIYVSWMAFCFD